MTLIRSVGGLLYYETFFSLFTQITPIVYMTGIVFCTLLGYFLLNRGLKHYNTIYTVPLWKAGDLYHNLMCGGIFLREFGEYTSIQFSFFITGVVVCA